MSCRLALPTAPPKWGGVAFPLVKRQLPWVTGRGGGNREWILLAESADAAG